MSPIPLGILSGAAGGFAPGLYLLGTSALQALPYFYGPDGWSQVTADLSLYAGSNARLVLKYTASDDPYFDGDVQVDAIDFGGNYFNFDDGIPFETSQFGEADYSTVSWLTAGTGSRFDTGTWNISSATWSNQTGRFQGFDGPLFAYAETNSDYTNEVNPGHNFWLRSPAVALTSNSLSFFVALDNEEGYDFTISYYIEVVA